mgnify:CR=1 FL=1
MSWSRLGLGHLGLVSRLGLGVKGLVGIPATQHFGVRLFGGANAENNLTSPSTGNPKRRPLKRKRQ